MPRETKVQRREPQGCRCYGQKNRLPAYLGIGACGVGGICPKV
ncbi:hypothetical protein E2C01_012979 [Portunus trituberculatus]|uniref:Uncharacterized protein n=1 Tax=Portunus trituberculatus TaxID=210409 RepID=A0A5B7DFV6_PORTR|nr:hypothetical protein [Portunus trituberculatus]